MKILKLSIKIILICIALFALIVSLFFLYSGTPHFERRLKRLIEERASGIPGCSLSIGDIRFSPYRLRITAKNLKFQYRSDSFSIEDGQIAELKIWFPFSSISDLFSGKITIKQVLLKSPEMKFILEKEAGDAFSASKYAKAFALKSFEIGKLAVSSGVLSVNERSFPIDLSIQNIKINYQSKLLSSEGVLSCFFQIMRIGKIQKKEGDLHVRFKKKGGVFDVTDLALSGEWGRLQARGSLEIGGENRYDFTVATYLDVATLSDLAEPTAHLEGNLKLEGVFGGDLKEHEFQGTVSSKKVSAYGIKAEQLEARLRLSQDKIALHDLTCSFLGGKMNASLEGSFKGKEEPFALKAEVNSIDLSKAALLLKGNIIPIEGYLSGEADVRFTSAPLKLVSGNILLNLVKKESEAPAGKLNAAGRIAASIGEGVISMKEGLITTDFSRLEATGIVYPLEKSELEFRFRSEEVGEVASIASSFLSLQKIREQIQTEILSLKGRCALSGKVKFGKQVIGETEYDFSDLSFMNIMFGKLTGSLAIDGNLLKLRYLKLEGKEGKADLQGSIELRDYGNFEIEGHMRELPIQHLLKIMGREKIPVEASAAIQCSVHGLNGKLEGYLKAQIGKARIYGQEFDAGEASMIFKSDRVILSSFDMQGMGGSIKSSGEYNITGKSLAVHVTGENLEISKLSALRSEKVSLMGKFDLAGDVTLENNSMKGMSGISSKEIFYNGISTGPLTFESTFDYPHMMFKARLERLNSRLSGILLLEKDFPFEGTLEFERSDLAIAGRFLRLASSLEMEGFVTASASFSGKLKDLEDLKVSAEVAAFELKVGGNIYRNASALPIKYESGEVKAENVSLVGKDTNLSIDALINIAKNQMKLKASGDFDLSILAAFDKDVSASGRGHLEVFSEGKFQNPDLKGTIQISNGRLRHFSFPFQVEALNLSASFDRDYVNFTTITCQFGGGEVKGNGIASIQKLGYDIYSFELEGNNVSLKFPDGLKYSFDGRLIIRGERTSAIISGDIDIIRGIYFKDFGFEPQLISRKGREYQPFESKAIPENIYLDMDVKADEGFWIKNDMANTELEGNLHIGGDLSKVEVTGRLVALEGGSLKFGDAEYEIKEGFIDFTDITKIDPSFDITAETIISDYQISARITGTRENFQIQFSSTPSLPQQDIVALLVAGITLESMDQESRTAFTQDMAASTGDLATSFVAGKVSGKLEKQLKQKLKLEKVQIDPLLIENQTDPTARFTFGKKLSDNLMIIYSTYLGGNEENAYQLDYKILKNLDFIGERTSTGAVGGDLRYRTQFRFKGNGKKIKLTDQRSAKIKNILVESDCSLTAKKLIRKLPFKKGKEFKRKLINEGLDKIKENLIKQGFLKASVSHKIEKEDDGYTVRYSIKCGERNNIILNGCARNEEKAIRKKIAEIAKESVFPQELTSEIEEMIRNFYQDDGYYAVDISVKEEIREQREELAFTLDKGERVQVDKILITGNRAFTEEKIKKQMLIREDSVFNRGILKPKTLKEDILAIKNLYVENGFTNVGLEEPAISISANGKKATVLINIDEGDIVKISEIIFEGNTIIHQDELSHVIASKIDLPLISSRVLNDKTSLKQHYDSIGFPEVKISTSVMVSQNKASVSFKINEGTRKKVGEIVITGNRLTKEKIIQKRLVLKIGDYMSMEKMLQSQNALYQLGIFKKVTISRSPSEVSGIETIRVNVEEADNLSLAVGGGYDNVSGLRGYFELSDNNFLGYDRYASFLARGSAKESRIQFLFRVPKFFKFKESTLMRRNLDSIFSTFWEKEERESFNVRRVESSLQVSKKLSTALTRYVRYNFQNVKISDLKISFDELMAEESKLENLRLSSIGLSFIRDMRNDPFQTEKGTYASADGRVYARVIGSDVDFAKLFLQGSYYKNIGKGFLFASFFRAGFAQGFRGTHAIPLSERFFAGGPYSIRGFRRDEAGPKDPVTGKPLGGESVLILNEEFHIPIYGKLKGIIFYDAGNVYLKVKNMDRLDFRHILGAGIRLETPIGPIRIEYGRKLDKEEGESNGEFFISIGQLF